MDIFTKILAESWQVLLESAPYMLFGFLAAGTIKAFLPESLAARHLGKSGFASVFKAALIGVPLPLCSCGVIPAAAELRRRGASKGATAAFLISTPETGVDSISVTYALMGPFMAVLRPLAAFLTAMIAGVLVNLGDKDASAAPAPAPLEPLAQSGCGCKTCCAAHTPQTFVQKLLFGIRYAFGNLLADIGPWFMLGVVLAGLIGALLPEGVLSARYGQGFLPMLAMLGVAIPLYVCATASTPIAAALALKGLSPGAALVFLLAGPATNAATIAVTARILGKKAAAVSLCAIIVASLALGLATNHAFTALGLDAASWIAASAIETPGPLSLVSAIVLLALIAGNILKPFFQSAAQNA